MAEDEKKEEKKEEEKKEELSLVEKMKAELAGKKLKGDAEAVSAIVHKKVSGKRGTTSMSKTEEVRKRMEERRKKKGSEYAVPKAPKKGATYVPPIVADEEEVLKALEPEMLKILAPPPAAIDIHSGLAIPPPEEEKFFTGKDEQEFKKHFEELDNQTQAFFNANFMVKPEIYAAGFGSHQIEKIHDPLFYQYLIKKVNNDIQNLDIPNKIKMFYGSGGQIIPTSYEGKDKKMHDIEFPDLTGSENEIEKKYAQLADIIKLYDAANISDLLAVNMHYNTSFENLKPEDLQKFYAIDSIENESPDKIAREYLARKKTSKDQRTELQSIIEDAEQASADLENFGDQLEYQNIMHDLNNRLESVLKSDKDLEDFKKKAIARNKLRFLEDWGKFENYIGKIRSMALAKPNNATSIQLLKEVKQIEDDIKHGKILNMSEAFNRLNVLEPVKESILDEKMSEVEFEPEEKEEEIEEEVIQHQDIEDYYNAASNAKFVALPGIKIQGETAVGSTDNIYEMSYPKVVELRDNLNNILDDLNLETTDWNDPDILPDPQLRKAAGDLRDRLESMDLYLDPTIFPIANDLTVPTNSNVIREHANQLRISLVDDVGRLNTVINKLKLDKKHGTIGSEINNKLNEINLKWQTDIDDEKDPNKKADLEAQRNLEIKTEIEKIKNQIYRTQKGTTKAINRLQTTFPSFKPVKSRTVVKRTLTLHPKKVKVSAQPKIIIPRSQLKAQGNKKAAFAQGAIYATKSLKHEPSKGKVYYPNAIEYRINTAEDLLNMVREVRSKKGRLSIVDLTTGRLYPIEPDKAVVGGIYIFQISTNGSSELGGGFNTKKPKNGHKIKHKVNIVDLPENAPLRTGEQSREKAYYAELKRRHKVHAWYPMMSKLIRDEEEEYFPYEWMRNGNDKAHRFIHKIPKKGHTMDYRHQIKRIKGGSIWKSIKHGLKKYVVDNTTSAAKNLAHQTVGEAKNFVQQERKNLNTIVKANKDFYKNPSLKGFARVVGDTTSGVGKLVAQPAFTSMRELANVSDFAGKVPGLNILKAGAEYAIPGLGVLDAMAHATKSSGLGSEDKFRLLDTALNATDAILGSDIIGASGLSGKIETGTKILNTGLKIADKFEKHN